MSHHPKQLDHLTVDELAAHCFGCGAANPQGLHLRFTVHTPPPPDEHEITATATVQLTELHQGPPGYIHGGIISTLLDEAMSKLNRPLGLLAMTRHMSVDYLRPAPLHTPLTLTARHLRREGPRKLFHTADLLAPDGTPLAHAEALFLAIDPSLLQRRPTSSKSHTQQSSPQVSDIIAQ